MTGAIVFLVASFLVQTDTGTRPQTYDAFDKTIPELQKAMESGEVSSVELVHQSLERIETFDRRGPQLRAMVFVNPKALELASELDRERRERGARGPLHGIPVVLKDNYDTADMPTSAGSVALAGYLPADDGTQVARLRAAGVVFVGKTNMHELAFGITTVGSLGGQTKNPYDPDRNPGGSSGGTGAAVATGFAAVGMGSDTCGSIRIPAANNNLFGLRVTQGLSSRDGIVPLSHSQDVGGPLARSVVDLAMVLDATVGLDENDKQTAIGAGHVPESYTNSLNSAGLEGRRLGLLTPYLNEDGAEKEVTDVVMRAASSMEAHGATLVEVDLPGLAEILAGSSVIFTEFKFDLRDYLAAADKAPVSSLTEILERGLYHEALEGVFRRSEQAQENSEEYRRALDRRDVVRAAITGLMHSHRLDAVVYPTLRLKPARLGEAQRGSSCSLSAHSGLPAFSLPAGFTEDGVPVGIELLGARFSEPALIEMAYAYEQKTEPRRPPPRTPSLLGESLSIDFTAENASIGAKLRLDRPAQTLHYELHFPGRLDDELLDVKLHRLDEGTAGPVLALLGIARDGRVSIRNQHLPALVAGELALVVYAVDAPRGAALARIVPITSRQ